MIGTRAGEAADRVNHTLHVTRQKKYSAMDVSIVLGTSITISSFTLTWQAYHLAGIGIARIG